MGANLRDSTIAVSIPATDMVAAEAILGAVSSKELIVQPDVSSALARNEGGHATHFRHESLSQRKIVILALRLWRFQRST